MTICSRQHETNEVREEHVKLRTAIWKLSEAINASYEAVEPFVEKRYLDSHVVEHANHYRVALFKHIMPAPSTRTRRQDDLLSMMKNYPPVFDEPISFRIYKSMFLHGAGGAFETAKVALFLTGYHDNEEFLKRAHYSLSAYTNFQVMIRRLYFEALLMMNIRCVFGTEDGVVKHWGKDEIWRSHQRIPSLEAVLADGVKLQAAGWWKSGLLSGAKKFLSADEFNNTSKDYSALRLKAFLDENYGHSHWPMKEVHRFGVLIFNDSFAYTPGIEEDPRAVFFRWEGKSAYVLIYKSTFGEEGNETYIHNKKFYWNNTNQIEDTVTHFIFRGSCLQLWNYIAPVSAAFKPAVEETKALNHKLFYFWLTNNQKVQNPKWTSADVALALDSSGTPNSLVGGIIEAELRGSYCFGTKNVQVPVMVIVGY
ncbi:hypothetical protein QR680_004258 [Steinernema hermaphroditum]|uniref:Uncharacterized protein n=1 Tax=Steinernema hermaphroditum TaxID=289476 RepID=A0AA39HN57_9BILA|nr:hypothetical protein QR680_004258 [Steinernema hermaphroditum]